MRSVLATVAYFALLVVGCGLSFCGWKAFQFCEFIYTDSYYTDRLMHVPEGMPHTWRDSVGYWSGLALWTLPSLILVVPGFIILFVALRGIFSRPVNDENHNQEAEQAAP
jgi:hypothetical protein